MRDSGLPVEFGIFPSPDAARWRETLELVQRAEVDGLDLVSVQDHPYQRAHLDMWTLLSVIAARTTAIRVSPNVASLPLRPPVMLAKAAATLDVLSGGRVELGLGAGAFWDPVVAAGGPRRSPRQAVDALVEAIGIIRAFWAGGPVRFEGEHYTAVGLRPGPPPAHDIPIWVGAYKPRMLALTGRLADAWIPSMGYADPSALSAMNAVIDEAAEEAGRSPSAIRRMYNISGRFGAGNGFLQGPAAQWAEDLAGLVIDEGMSSFVLATDDPQDVSRFALEVAPAVRELVDAERAGGRSEPVAVPPTPQQSREQVATSAPTAALGPNARHLKDIHDHLRAELAQVRDLVEQVRAGHLHVGQARSAINTMTMRQNNWTLGAYCASYCRIVTGHHTLEDRSVFPHLRAADDALAPVIDRLEAEHVTVHGLVERLDRALVGLVEDDGYGTAGRAALDELAASVDELTGTLLEHLAYEEAAIGSALDAHGFS
jgi:alkanesulfonate monooxygenase SsuD/methylene tetrahydromethanopterin reductase-like flavin-dependent oxidoreductase (luciferase family)